jgi:hypothetical protein
MIGICDASLSFFAAEIGEGPDRPVDLFVWLGGRPRGRGGAVLKHGRGGVSALR